MPPISTEVESLVLVADKRAAVARANGYTMAATVSREGNRCTDRRRELARVDDAHVALFLPTARSATRSLGWNVGPG